jgi:hypothetical protein
MIYTHVARLGVAAVTSPLDLLNDVNADEVQAAVEATRQLTANGGVAACASWSGAGVMSDE